MSCDKGTFKPMPGVVTYISWKWNGRYEHGLHKSLPSRNICNARQPMHSTIQGDTLSRINRECFR